MCLAPCFKGCSNDRYQQEAIAVEQFLATRGQSRLIELRTLRDEASTNLEFEAAAGLHAQVQRVESVRSLAAELVRPLNQLRTVILQASALPGEVSVFLFADGCFSGPASFSTQGMRIQNEQSGSTSLFPHPVAIEPVPEQHAEPGLDPQPSADTVAPEEAIQLKIARPLLEARMEAVLSKLEQSGGSSTMTRRQGDLALLQRWYFRPETKRSGEIFFPGEDGQWPIKALLRGAGRVVAKMWMQPEAGAEPIRPSE